MGSAAVLIVVVCVFLLAVLFRQGLVAASLWATVLGLPVGLVGAIASIWALTGTPSKALRPSELKVPKWVVDRPAEVAEAVAALLGGRDAEAGITASLYGAGGFGKTTLATMVCARSCCAAPVQGRGVPDHDRPGCSESSCDRGEGQ